MSSTLLVPGAALGAPTYTADPYRPTRRRTRVVMVGSVGVGGDNPIRLQSMTTTRTQDVEATTAQAIRLVEAGCEIVRITAPTASDAQAIGAVRARLRALGIGVPLVADIHFSPAAALAAVENAEKVRINPGNFADSRKFAVREYSDAAYEGELARIATRISPLILACKERGVALRIGTNHGSLSDRVMNRFGDTPEGMVESALEFVRICESLDYREIILSMKASNPKVMIAAYRLLVARMDAEGMDYPLHLGVTEAGNGDDARIKSAVGIGSLLQDGLGDTIRVSLAEEPEEEIPVARAIAALCVRPFAEQVPIDGDGAGQVPTDASPALSYDPFHYARRAARPLTAGALHLGGDATIAVASPLPAHQPTPLPVLGVRPRKPPRPDMVVLDVHDPEDLARLQALAWKGEGPAPRPLVARSASVDLLRASLSLAEIVCLTIDDLGNEPVRTAAVDLAREAATRGRTLWLAVSSGADGIASEVTVARLVQLAGACRAEGLADLLLTLRGRDVATTVQATRLLAASLAQAGLDCPLVLQAPDTEPALLAHAVALGALLCDGIGDAVYGESVKLSFDMLQGAGARLTRTDYVACPSCGRTLFDLQSTTDRIKAKTSHLKGLKIAIMGCIVNGPGEMADADFGYMGGSPGQVNLYVGKEVVERGVPEADAPDRLIALIRERGRWVEPGEDDE